MGSGGVRWFIVIEVREKILVTVEGATGFGEEEWVFNQVSPQCDWWVCQQRPEGACWVYPY